MEAEKRRDQIIDGLKAKSEPVSGTELATKYNVTRQVIVQDIALLRAKGYNILSTSRGYLLYETQNQRPSRMFPVKHNNEAIRDELETIIDLGGTVLNVIVEHPIYGEITVSLVLKSRYDIDAFMKHLKEHQTLPLMHLTGGEHYHTVEADSENILNTIEQRLNEKGYLIK